MIYIECVTAEDGRESPYETICQKQLCFYCGEYKCDVFFVKGYAHSKCYQSN